MISGSHFSKAVFGDDTEAASYAAAESWRVQIGNTVYIDTSLIAMAELMNTTKVGMIAEYQDNSHYLSRP